MWCSATQLRVSRSALVANLNALRRNVAPDTLIAPIVKANAYGHGRDLIAGALADEVDFFTVAEPSDALAIAGIAPGRVLCLGPAYGRELAELIGAGVRVTVSDPAALPELGPGAVVHLLVDTGLHRLGVAPTHAVELAEAIRGTGATLEGVFCHVAGADHGDWSAVEAEVRTLRQLPIEGVLRHTGGSSLPIVRPDLVCDITRLGVAVYGYVPHPSQKPLIELRQAATLVAPVLELRRVVSGEGVGYAATPVARDTVVATLPLGVCHGLNPHWADGGGYVTIRNQRCPLLSNPMLDYTIVDVTDVPGAAVTEMATVFGDVLSDGGDAGPSVEETARRLGILPEHVLVALHDSIPRVLVD